MAIQYNLICSAGHETTGRYSSIAAFEKTRDGGFLECATCLTQGIRGSTVQQGLSKPNINSGVSRENNAPPQTKSAQPFDDVGDRLFETAGDIALGKENYRPLRGRLSHPGEAHALDQMGWHAVVEAKAPKLDS